MSLMALWSERGSFYGMFGSFLALHGPVRTRRHVVGGCRRPHRWRRAGCQQALRSRDLRPDMHRLGNPHTCVVRQGGDKPPRYYNTCFACFACSACPAELAPLEEEGNAGSLPALLTFNCLILSFFGLARQTSSATMAAIVASSAPVAIKASVAFKPASKQVQVSAPRVANAAKTSAFQVWTPINNSECPPAFVSHTMRSKRYPHHLKSHQRPLNLL